MAVPLFHELIAPPRQLREIETYFQVGSIAQSTSDLVKLQQVQQAAMEQDRAAALAHLHELQTTSSLQPEMLAALQTLIGSFKHISDTLAETRELNELLLSATTDGFNALTTHLLEQHTTLQQIAENQRNSYDLEVQQLLRAAGAAIDAAKRASSQKDRVAEAADATRLLKAAVANPLGSRNYVAWFHLGWVLWQFDEELPKAEEAFYNAERLSRDESAPYHLESLHNLAEVQHQQSKFPEAYDSLSAANATSADVELLYLAARCAARTGRLDEATSHLTRCLILQPAKFPAMLREPDLLDTMNDRLIFFAALKLREARSAAVAAVERWTQAIQQAVNLERIVACDMEADASVLDKAPRYAKGAETADYVTASALLTKATSATRTRISTTIRILEAESEALHRRLADARHTATQAQKHHESIQSAKHVFRPMTPDEPQSFFRRWMNQGKEAAAVAEQQRRWEEHKASIATEAQAALKALHELQRSAGTRLERILELLESLRNQP